MKVKQHKCPFCKDLYQKQNSLQKTCFKFDCIKALLDKQKAAKLTQERKEGRKADKDMRLKIKTRSQWMKEAQTWFNRFIRLRDAGNGCIDCGKFVAEKHGGNYDAGHFLSVGAYPELRFNEDNCHLQAKSCNAGSGKYSHKQKTVSQTYRENLIKKIGIERVEILEGPHEPKKYTVEELKEIIQTYKKKVKQLGSATIISSGVGRDNKEEL